MSAGYGPTQIDDGNPDGAVFGASATEKIGFYGATPVVQRAGGAQSAIEATIVSSSAFGATQQAALAAAIDGLNEVIATLTALGLWKGGE